ncbi:aminoglycoside phosphotransferase family protein [Paenibacillus zeisoli]|uniref:Aminoglycoside phosphotransferase family protein n=1 Tax=Paenibacillus zeisoli TaxID=2496267 RepID=A0A3S1DCK2_9BACL|nr:phosphotransferase [Paenibacillus zeisoli]RUT35761.1 aminoglycoside phosphotransferase family protein [Paenibacillus zeisoli]
MKQLLIEHIPFLHGKVQIEQIHKGYSSESKYIVFRDDQKFLLRTFDNKLYSTKEIEFQALLKMKEYNVKCSRPLEMGNLESQGIGFMILSFIEGDDASEVLSKISMREQFNIGFEAGVELQKIHQYIAPNSVSTWYERKFKKHKQYLDKYLQLNVRIKDDSRLLSFIEDHLQLMKHRPNLFQHDDFHVGNLIIKDNQFSGVIDFNRYDWGDPIHEFLKVGMFSSEVSVPFSIGQIRGYHKYSEPNDLFWRLYSLYLAMCLISSIVWIIRVKPEETKVMMDKIDRVLEDHEYFRLIRPKWYSEL